LHITSSSIRHLDFQSSPYQAHDRCFNNKQCSEFLRSSLAKQCEVLEIVFDNRSNIDDLINEMTNLQALKMIYQLGQWNNYRRSREELIALMKSGFSCTFTENVLGTLSVFNKNKIRKKP